MNTPPAPNSLLRKVQIVLCYCLLVILMACGSDSTQQNTSFTTDTVEHVIIPDTSRKEAVYVDDEEDELRFTPKEISSKTIGAGNIPAGVFNPVEALKMLLPGNYYSFPAFADSSRTEQLIAWKCTNCKQMQLKGWQEEDPEPFPYADGNMTMYTDTLQYTGDNGVQHVLMVLSSLPVQTPEFMHTGRFSCAVLGLALFANKDGKWELVTFAPHLGCYGAFQTMPKMHLVRLGRNNYGCYLFDTNGGAGGPFYSDIYMFGLVKGQFRKIMGDMSVQRYNAGECEWTAVVNSNNTASTEFGKLNLAITGIYSKQLFESNDTASNLPKELMAHIKSKDTFNFIITREYRFEQGAYRYSGSQTDVR